MNALVSLAAARWMFRSMLLIAAPASSLAQNVVNSVPALDVLPRETLSTGFAHELVSLITAPGDNVPVPSDEAARRVAAKLEAHVRELIDRWPWRPLHHVLGISGFETYFDHPDELFYAVALAEPFLSAESQKRVVAFLRERLAEIPPFAIDGFDRDHGSPRESYDVPEALRAHGRGSARSLFGISGFALFVAQLDDTTRSQIDLAAHWRKIRERITPFLAEPNRVPSGDTEQLNGNLAGLLGAAQLAIAMHDDEARREITAGIQQLAQRRVDLERTNPHFVEKAASASKNLHNFKLARYCAFTPAVAQCLQGTTRTVAAKRLCAFRQLRPGWHVALGERLIGGENYTNPLHFGRALFAGAALLEELPRDELLRLIDVPACRADFYFIEKCALALRRPPR
jgi:hypothetical protein